jgi:hypothetical protein
MKIEPVIVWVVFRDNFHRMLHTLWTGGYPHLPLVRLPMVHLSLQIIKLALLFHSFILVKCPCFATGQ